MSLQDFVRNNVQDTITGPYEGIDFWFEGDEIYVNDNNIKLAAKILREVNFSSKFTSRLVKHKTSGDTIKLGFDLLLDMPAVYSKKVGPKKQTIVELKRNEIGRYAMYVNKERISSSFKTLKAAKNYIKNFDAALCSDDKNY